jgi:hypothetical protein
MRGMEILRVNVGLYVTMMDIRSYVLRDWIMNQKIKGGYQIEK